MQEIKKTRIVLASILKPVDDTRMFEKLGMSLLLLKGDVQVHILGFPSVSETQSPEGISFHPLNPFSRLSLQRILAPWKIARKTMRLKPSLLIINTHELLPMAMVVKTVTNCRVIYDVRENYFKNILFTTAFPRLLRPVLAGYVRFVEMMTSPFIDHFLLAEKAYANELKFPGNRKTIVENKLKLLPAIAKKHNHHEGKIALLFSGTLAESTGVFTAIDLATALHEENPSVFLTIIGYAAQKNVLEKLQVEIKHKTFIRLVGGNTLVPHGAILDAIQASDAGIIAYTPNPSTENSIPTKLYEYLGLQLPIILINHTPWVALCEPYQAAIPFDANDILPQPILQALQEHSFYTTVPENISWESEEKKFLVVVKNLL